MMLGRDVVEGEEGKTSDSDTAAAGPGDTKVITEM
jgi:hypothetical protein